MYTRQGQVTNSITIQNFLQRLAGTNNPFILNTSVVSIPVGLLTLNVTQNNSVSILQDSSTVPIQAEIISQSSSQIVIARIDSFSVSVGNNNYKSRCDTLITAINYINPILKYYPLPLGSGYSGYYKYRATIPIEIKKGQLVLPLMTFLVNSSNAGSYCYITIEDEWNSFNSNIKDQLHDGDTIAYQIKEVQLLRQ